MLYTRQHALLLGVAGALVAALSLTVCRPHPWPYALHTDLVTRHSIGSTCDRDVALQRKDRRISLTRSRHAKLRGEWRFDPHTTCFHAGPDERRQIGRLGPEQARRRYVVASLQRSGSPSSVCRSFYEQTTLEAFNIIPDWATNNTFIAKASLGRPCAAVHARERSGVAAGICDDCGGFHPRHVSAHSGRERGRASAHHRDRRRPRQARCTCAAAHELPLTQLVPRGTLRIEVRFEFVHNSGSQHQRMRCVAAPLPCTHCRDGRHDWRRELAAKCEQSTNSIGLGCRALKHRLGRMLCRYTFVTAVLLATAVRCGAVRVAADLCVASRLARTAGPQCGSVVPTVVRMAQRCYGLAAAGSESVLFTHQ